MLQSLEQRRMFAISVAAGLATINGTASDDVLEVILDSGKIQVRNGAGTITDQVSSAGILKIAVNGGGGNDFIRMGRNDGSKVPNVPVTLSGGAGNDTLIGGPKADQLFGGADSDKLDGRAGGDILNGGDGFDTTDYSYRTVPVTVTLINSLTANDGSTTGDNSILAKSNDNGGDNCVDVEAVVGGTGNDKITGNDFANWLDGGSGNDSLYGLAGVDTITGGVNNDLGYGGLDSDFFFMKDTAADQFLGEGGTTSAQYDSGVDSPAPVQASKPASKSKLIQTIASNSDNLILDTTFNSTGLLTTMVDGATININDVTIQRLDRGDGIFDDKILAVGEIHFDGCNSDFVLIRYNMDGSLDTDFGPDESGIVHTDFTPLFSEVVSTNPGGDFNDAANSVLIDSSGNIVVAGNTAVPYGQPGRPGTLTASGYSSVYAIARYSPNGSLDPFFGSGGITSRDPDGGNYSFDYATRIAEQDVDTGEGIIRYYVVGGTVGNSLYDSLTSAFGDDFGVIRLWDDGSYDSDFGLQRVDFGTLSDSYNQDQLTGLIIDPATNMIWVSGTTSRDSTQSDIGYAAIFQDGGIIPTTMNTLTFADYDSATNMTTDGTNLYIVGNTNPNNAVGRGTSGATVTPFIISSGVVAKIPIQYPVGSRNAVTSELATGIVTKILDSSTGDLTLSGVALDANGHLVVSGTNGAAGMYVQQLDLDTLDPVGTAPDVSFGTPDDNSYDFNSSVAVQPDGGIVVVGQSNGRQFGQLARLVHDSAEVWVDIPIDDTGVQDFNFTTTDPQGNTVPVPTYLSWRDTALQPDGSVVIPGTNLDDNIYIDQDANFITINRNGEILQIPVGSVTKIIVNGGDGNDTIYTSTHVKVPVIIDGGKGNDTITGSNQKESIYGGDGNDRINAGDGNDFVDCGKGDDVGLGGFGNDSILGGDGRDVLVGGDGVDTLKGGAGDDALIAGGTKYSNTPEIFDLIRKEWSRTDATYATRVNHLVNGGGFNGTYLLNKNTMTSSSVLADVLTGNTEKDAFWGNFIKPGDIITDLVSGEIVTQVKK